MRYFVIAGESSGDVHASNLVRSVQKLDSEAVFMGLGGDRMRDSGVELVRHYRDMAYMGIIAVIKNLDKVFDNINAAKDSINKFRPDAVILVDYPSFNLRIAEYVKKNLPGTKVIYYISPKLWAWKSWRLKTIRKYVDNVLSILPFEVEWYGSRGYQVDYVGNPSVDEIESRPYKDETEDEFRIRYGLDSRPVIALLCGSRMQEVCSCLPKMLSAANSLPGYNYIVAGADSIDRNVYDSIINNQKDVRLATSDTYSVVSKAKAAVVCSGTATLETALLDCPQVVVYHLFGGWIVRNILQRIIKVRDVALCNIVAGDCIAKELLLDRFTPENVVSELKSLLTEEVSIRMKKDYAHIRDVIGLSGGADRAAKKVIDILSVR